MADESHTILLVQYNVQLGSRCYHDFEGRSLALDCAHRPTRRPRRCSAARWRDFHAPRADLLGIYEKELKRLNPGSKSITYDIADVHGYLDQLSDVACLECALLRRAAAPPRRHRKRSLTSATRERRASVPNQSHTQLAASRRPCRFDSSLGAYVPRRKPWLKDQLIKHLQQQAEEDGE